MTGNNPRTLSFVTSLSFQSVIPFHLLYSQLAIFNRSGTSLSSRTGETET
ncbi:uncharacterized protein MELLADRAFT_90004 [Melampsora larici-populina 98AG31]|uniref:Uncharacterized protein n=1 Tax=Melampsora larici-populina (strain 98AG31 / pathotype 3-4-7) TaxID=747676 RepID=F4RVE1_MELLP|nr:uncharacterized protein MELLADRAFT_90004 [Melampsora larici-populina 98AG31]EGG03607.1 hypothetical protein MELLADRAFT_90004 [Melampsora larici-populina 98AG31]